MATPTYGGVALFGKSVSVKHNPNANAAQIAAFFGVNNVQTLDGGSRGRVFEITGCLYGATPAACVFAEQFLLSFGDGIGRTLIDTTGLPWSDVVFKREFTRQGQFMKDCTFPFGWILPYSCLFYGLS